MVKVTEILMVKVFCTFSDPLITDQTECSGVLWHCSYGLICDILLVSYFMLCK